MSENDDPARLALAAIEAHGLKPTDEEIAMYSAMAPLLREMTDQIHAVEIDGEP